MKHAPKAAPYIINNPKRERKRVRGPKTAVEPSSGFLSSFFLAHREDNNSNSGESLGRRSNLCVAFSFLLSTRRQVHHHCLLRVLVMSRLRIGRKTSSWLGPRTVRCRKTRRNQCPVSSIKTIICDFGAHRLMQCVELVPISPSRSVFDRREVFVHRNSFL